MHVEWGRESEHNIECERLLWESKTKDGSKSIGAIDTDQGRIDEQLLIIIVWDGRERGLADTKKREK